MDISYVILLLCYYFVNVFFSTLAVIFFSNNSYNVYHGFFFFFLLWWNFKISFYVRIRQIGINENVKKKKNYTSEALYVYLYENDSIFSTCRLFQFFFYFQFSKTKQRVRRFYNVSLRDFPLCFDFWPIIRKRWIETAKPIERAQMTQTGA